MATITIGDAKTVASLSKSDGRKLLIKGLKWVPFDEDKDMRQSVHLDILYDNLMFAAEKGFTWEKATYVVKFADLLVQQMKGCNKITDILSFFNSKSSYLCECLGETEYKIYSSFIFETILPHFKLYKLVFTTARLEQIPNIPLKVEPPFDSKELKETKPIKVWDYEKKIEELEKKESDRVNERLVEKGQKLSQLHSQDRQSVEVERPLDKDTVESMIKEVMKQYSVAATETIKLNIEHLQEDLEFKLEKTTVPRPQALGPPPRYSVQSVKTPSSKTPKSPKPASRGSGRSKKK